MEQRDYACKASSALNRGTAGKEGAGWSEAKHKGAKPSAERTHKIEKKIFSPGGIWVLLTLVVNQMSILVFSF